MQATLITASDAAPSSLTETRAVKCNLFLLKISWTPALYSLHFSDTANFEIRCNYWNAA